MDRVQRLYLDTNIFILLGEGEEDERRDLLLDLVKNQADARDKSFLVTSELTLAELLVHPFRRHDTLLSDLYASWVYPDCLWMEVLPVQREILIQASVIRRDQRTVKLPDAIHLATAANAGYSHFLSFDASIPSFRDVTTLVPTSDLLQMIARQRQ